MKEQARRLGEGAYAEPHDLSSNPRIHVVEGES